jgi:AcrR family transcriptional regulator
MPSRSRRARYLGPARRREPVLDAALGIFTEGGFEAASMVAIAERAEVAKPVLYDCFPGGKEELWRALLEREERRFLDHMGDALRSIEGEGIEPVLTGGLLGLIGYADISPQGFSLIFGSAGTNDPELARRIGAAREVVIGWVADFLAAASPRRVLGNQTELFIRAVVAVAEEAARWSLQHPEADQRETVERLVRWFMHGFGGMAPARQ